MWRSEDEMLEVVRQRAARARARRQRVVGTGAAIAVALVFATAVVFVRLYGDGGSGGGALHVAASGTGPTTSTSVPSVQAVPFPTTSTAASSAESTTPAASATTVTTVPSSTVPPTTVATDEPATTTTPPLVAPCGPGDALATTSVDKQTYLPGQPVRVTATLQNVSGRTCEGAVRTSGSSIEVTNGAGVRVYGMGGVFTHQDCFVVSPACSWPEGETETTTPCWDQTDTTQAQVPPGTYTVTIRWMGPIGASASATFQIVPDPAAPTTTVPASRCP